MYNISYNTPSYAEKSTPVHGNLTLILFTEPVLFGSIIFLQYSGLWRQEERMGSASLTAVSFVNEIKFGLCLEDSFSVFFWRNLRHFRLRQHMDQSKHDDSKCRK